MLPALLLYVGPGAGWAAAGSVLLLLLPVVLAASFGLFFLVGAGVALWLVRRKERERVEEPVGR